MSMKEHPILFSARMAQAILEDRKTQTRQPVTARNSIVGVGRVDWQLFDWEGWSIYVEAADWPGSPGPNHRAPLPFVDGQAQTGQYLHVPYNWAENATVFRIRPRYQVGDHLWVREPWAAPAVVDHLAPSAIPHQFRCAWYDMCPPEAGKRRPGPSMPRWASRLTLVVTGVRVQHVQDISAEDVLAEGYTYPWTRGQFAAVWESINGREYPWRSNPYVWVREFERLRLPWEPVQEWPPLSRRAFLRLPLEQQREMLRRQAADLLREKPDYGVEE